MQWGRLLEASIDSPDGGTTLMPASIKMATTFINSCYPKMEESR